MPGDDPAGARPPHRRDLVLGALASGLGPACGTGAAAQPGSAAAGRSLSALAADRGIVFGMAVTAPQFEDTRLRAIILAEAGMLVPGLELKWAHVEPRPGAFAFRDAEVLVDAASARGLKARGHALVWHEALPAEVAAIRDARVLAGRVRRHIRTVCGRFAGRMQSWDVVNEAIEPGADRPDGLRRTPFRDVLGPDYIERAFELAAEADPAAVLTLNEYDLERDTPWHASRRRATLALLDRLVRRRVPIGALGIQGHLAPGTGRLDAEIFRRFIRDVASLGLAIYITELDVVDRALPADIAARDRAAAEAARGYLDAALAEPAVRMVVTWGVSDAYNWVDGNPGFRRRDGLPARPNPYDAAFRAKPLRAALAATLHGAPRRPLQ